MKSTTSRKGSKSRQPTSANHPTEPAACPFCDSCDPNPIPPRIKERLVARLLERPGDEGFPIFKTVDKDGQRVVLFDLFYFLINTWKYPERIPDLVVEFISSQQFDVICLDMTHCTEDLLDICQWRHMRFDASTTFANNLPRGKLDCIQAE